MQPLQKKNLQALITTCPDFPKKGVTFYDIMPIFASHQALTACVELMAQQLKALSLKYVVGLQSRGFLLGVPLALKLGIGFIPIRKKGKLPGKTYKVDYDLQYGKDCIEIQEGRIQKGDPVVICDDLLATGGTLAAALELVEQVGAKVEATSLLIDLGISKKDLKGCGKIQVLFPDLKDL